MRSYSRQWRHVAILPQRTRDGIPLTVAAAIALAPRQRTRARLRKVRNYANIAKREYDVRFLNNVVGLVRVVGARAVSARCACPPPHAAPPRDERASHATLSTRAFRGTRGLRDRAAFTVHLYICTVSTYQPKFDNK